MAMFQYNWATAEMVKLYLRNSRAQAKRKATRGAKANADTPPVGAPGFTGADTSAGADVGSSGMMTNLEDDSDSDDSDGE